MIKEKLRAHARAFASDRRAWIPFALIGVLLLIISISLIVTLDTRDTPEPDIDEELVFDRAEATAQATIRTSIEEAVVEAGDAPVTNASHEALNQSHLESTLLEVNNSKNVDLQNFEELADKYSYEAADHVFKNYLRLLIYQRASEQLEGTRQEIRGVETTASLEELTTGNIEQKLNNVSLEVGYESDSPDSLEPGRIRVGLPDVNLEVIRDNETVVSRTTNMEVTVGTTLFALHNKTQEYDRQLNMGFFEGFGEGIYEGFGQYFAARLYPVALAKAGIEWSPLPIGFSEITSNRQSEVLANHATYGLQKKTFGTNDPGSTRAMAGAVLCMAAQIGADKAGEKLADKGKDKVEDSLNSTLLELTNMSAQTVGLIANKSATSIEDDLGDPSGTIGDMLCEGVRTVLDEDGIEPDQIPSLTDVIGGFKQPDSVTSPNATIKSRGSAAFAFRMTDGANPSGLGGGLPADRAAELKNELNVPDLLTVANATGQRNVSSKTAGNINSTFNDTSVYRELLPGRSTTDFVYQDDPETDIPEVIEKTFEVAIRGSPQTQFNGHSIDDQLGPPSGVSDPSNWSMASRTETIQNLDVTVDITKEYSDTRPAVDETFYDVTVEVTQDLKAEETWEYTENDKNPSDEHLSETDEVSADFELELSGEYSPRINVDRIGGNVTGIQNAYNDNGKISDNFDCVPEMALVKAFTGASGCLKNDVTDQVEDDIAKEIKDEYSPNRGDQWIDSKGQFTSTIDYNKPDTYEADDILDDRNNVNRWLSDELEKMVFGNESWDGSDNRTAYITDSLLGSKEPNIGSVTVNRTEFLTGSQKKVGLLDNLTKKLSNNESAIVYQHVPKPSDQYVNVSTMARAALYKKFVENTHDSIEIASDIRKEELKETAGNDDDGLLGGLINNATKPLGKAMSFMKNATGGSLLKSEGGEDAGELDRLSLMDNVTFQVHGSPTYLSLGNTTRSDSAAVRPGGVDPEEAGRFAGAEFNGLSGGPVAPADTNYSSMYAGYTNYAPYPGIPVLPPFTWAVSVSLWDVKVGGEYARFEVSARAGDPSISDTTTYVREDRPVNLTIDGEGVHVGMVEELDFDSRTLVLGLVPGGQPGIGDGDGLKGTIDEIKKATKSGDFESAAGVIKHFMGLFVACSENYHYAGPDVSEADLARHNNFGIIGTVQNKLNETNANVPLIDPVPQGVINGLKQAEPKVGCAKTQLEELVPLGGDDG